MNRTALLTAALAAAALGGVTIAAQSDEPSVPLLAVGTSAELDDHLQDDLELATATTAATAVEVPAPTTPAAPTTTTTVTAAPTTSTTARLATTTTVPAAPQVRPLGLRCAGSGDAKTGDEGPGAWVHCEVDGVHERAPHLVLTRDGEPIARTDKTGGTSFEDRAVRPGQTYSYQAHSYTADGTLLQSSDAVRATAGPAGERDDGPLALRCAGSGDGKTDRAKPGDREAEAVVHCQVKAWPERATHLVLTRDREPIARTDDRSVTTYDDWEVRPGGTYVYQAHAYAADGTLIESSEPVQAHS